MTVFELVAELKRLDVLFYLSGSELVVFLKDADTDALRNNIARLRGELTAYLRFTADPAHDHWGDSSSWRQLFGLAYETEGAGPDSVLQILRNLRARGARLERDSKKKSWRIIPVIGRWGWATIEDYQRYRQEYLMPRVLVIKTLLKKLG